MTDMTNPFDATALRRRFPIFQKKIYLNSCSQGALSDSVEEAFHDYLASWHAHGSPWEMWVEREEEARAAFAKFIGASADEVAVVTSASAGINSVASALDFRSRAKVVLGEFEFPTMGHIWLAQQPRGARVQFVDAEGERIPLENYARAIGRDTAMVGLTHVCFKNGSRSDVAGVVRLAHERGALVMLDDFQDCGTRPVNVKKMGVDFYVTGTLKYLLGPPGLAFLYVRKELIESFTPTISGWFAQTNPFTFNPKVLDLSPTARRFQSGSPSIPNVYGAHAGIELLQSVGMENVAGQIGRLARALLEAAAELGIRAKTPADSQGPLVVLKARDAAALVAKFAARNIVCSCRHDGLRISFHAYNTLDDVGAVTDALRQNLDMFDQVGVAAK
jgi:selenocysteine lyase/cysteine desulfurase